MNESNINVEIAGNTYHISTNYRLKSQDLILLVHGLGCSKDSFRDIWLHDFIKRSF